MFDPSPQWSLSLDVPPGVSAPDLVGSKLYLPGDGVGVEGGARAVGLITSSLPVGNGGAQCLCYVKGKAAGEGGEVALEGGGGGGKLVRTAYSRYLHGDS